MRTLHLALPRIPLLAAVSAACLLLACSGESPAPPEISDGPWRVETRLDPHPRGGPAALGEGVCAVGGGMRLSTECGRFHVVLDRKRTQPESGRVNVELRIKPKLQGQPLLIEPQFATRGQISMKSGSPQIVFPEGGSHPLQLELPPEAPTVNARVRVRAWSLARERAEISTGSVAIPAGARLAVDYGIESRAAAAGVGAARMWIDARRGDRSERLLDEIVAPDEGLEGWRRASVDLSALADGDWSFHFYSEPAEELGAAEAGSSRLSGSSFPVWGSPRILVRAPREKQRNIILVSLDTLRADHLEKQLGGKALMPHLASRAAEGALFDGAIAPYPSTTGSHMSLFTSLYTGVHDVGFPTQRLAAVIPTLPELLADAGYVTGAVTDNGMLSRGAGFGRGFDEYREFKDRSADYEGAIVRSVAEALRFVADHRDERFFLFLHTYQVHTPFAPPKKYDVFRAGSNPRSAEGLQGLYAGEVRYTDDILSALFGQIEKLGLGEETLVVVTSDHGEAFGEHGHWGHSISLYEEEIRVPLLWWGPGLVQPGTRLAAPTSLVDVPPTLLELVGAEALRWSQGQSLAAVLQGQPDAATDGERYAENRRKHAKQGSVAVRSSQHKWIRKGNEEEVEVYDLLEDSSEAEPLDDIELMAQGQALIQIFDEESAELRAAIAQAGSGEAAAPNVLDGETVERLRELGYVE